MALAMPVAGCGSGGGDDSTASLSKAQFVKQSNAICREGDARLKSDAEKFAAERNLPEHTRPSDAVLEEITESIIVPVFTSLLEEIRALGAPKGDEREVDAFLTGYEEALEKAEEDPLFYAENESPRWEQANRQASEYGLIACGEKESE